MSPSRTATSLHAQELVGRKVEDAAGNKLGRVYDLEAKRVGDQLCVTALLVGTRSWLTRFGWTKREHGQRIPWEEIEHLYPHIVLRHAGKKG